MHILGVFGEENLAKKVGFFLKILAVHPGMGLSFLGEFSACAEPILQCPSLPHFRERHELCLFSFSCYSQLSFGFWDAGAFPCYSFGIIQPLDHWHDPIPFPTLQDLGAATSLESLHPMQPFPSGRAGMDLFPTHLPWVWGVVTPWIPGQGGMQGMSSIPKTPGVWEQLWAVLRDVLFLASIEKGFGIRAFVHWQMGMGRAG